MHQVYIKTIIISAFLSFFLSASMAWAEVKAFPTAEGFGANAKGGRGGRVIEVTNLNDSGTGSLRSCAQATGPRTCVFKVSGTIQLLDNIAVDGEAMSYLTIAGQTSPGGVQLKGPLYGFTVRGGAHDVIIRYLRVRQGGPSGNSDIGNAILIYGNAGAPGPTHDVIVDHSSVAWGTDTMLMDYGDTHDVTLQWNLIAEPALNDASPGERGEGMHIGAVGGTSCLTSVHHNLFVHSSSRQPLLDGTAVTDFRNNVIYNYSGNNATTFGGAVNGERSAKANFVDNLYLQGPNSSAWTAGNPGSGWANWLANGNGYNGGTKLYVSGNWGPGCPSGCSNAWNLGFMDTDAWVANRIMVAASESKYRVLTPFAAPTIITQAPGDLLDVVLQGAGAMRPSRDTLDTRLVNDVRNRTGNLSNVTYGGPWPTLTGPAAPTDSDHDGITDSWESAHGLSPNSVTDGAAVSSNGYTNVENYLNELAGDAVPGGSVTPTPTPAPSASTSPSPLPCINPSPISSGFSAPCPVFSVSPQSGSLSQNFSVAITPDASKTVWTYKTLYITEGSTWKIITLPGTVQYTYWLQGNVTYNLQPTTLGLTAGTHYLASWDWTWDAAAQCYKGPGATTCGGGQYRIQSIMLQ